MDSLAGMQRPQQPLPETATRFEVDVKDTPLATLCDIVGRKILIVSGTDMAFEDPTSKFITFTFHMAWFRRFGVKKNGMFTFEVGRKCPNGEGFIHCKSASSKAIHDLLMKASANKSQIHINPSAISPKKVTQKESDLKRGVGEPSSSKGTRFDVDVQETPLATLCGIVGRKILIVSGTDMAFEDPTSKSIITTFQMAWLRRFGVKLGLLTLEVGRKCPNGEGFIYCKSAQNSRIVDTLVDVMNRKTSSSKDKTGTIANVVIPALTTMSNTSSTTGVDVDDDPLYFGYEDPKVVLATIQNDEVANAISETQQKAGLYMDEDQMYCYAHTWK